MRDLTSETELTPLLTPERETWLRPHSLGPRDATARRRQLEALEGFSRREGGLKLAFVASEGGEFLQWFVTDGVWCIGFMQLKDEEEEEGEEEDEEGEEEPRVAVTRLDRHCDFVTRDEFTLTDDVMRRMRNVCGGINHSFCLRNSEHLSKYIHCGSWSSLQMNPGSRFRNFFDPHLKSVAEKVNTPPEDIEGEEEGEEGRGEGMEEDDDEEDLIYPELKSQPSWTIHFRSHDSTLARVNEDAWNVLFLGPSGAGKSHVINLLFNKAVSRSAAAGASVTKTCNVFQGTWRGRAVNVIDTVGIANSESDPDSALTSIQSAVKSYVVLVDVVVVVVAERIADGHQRAIKKCLKWLQYGENTKTRFVFLYNKGDTIGSAAEKEKCLSDMGRLLGVDVSLETRWLRPDGSFSSLPTARVSSFPPLAPYPDVEPDRDLLMGQVMGIRRIPDCPRIRVSPGDCAIL